MKVLVIDYNYYLYPEETKTLETFMNYVNQNYNSFMLLYQLSQENCVAPYFIASEMKCVYINIANMNEIYEKDVTILTKSAYDKRLAICIQDVCTDCVHNIEDIAGDNLKGHRDKLSLDGICDWKQVDD